MPSNPSDERGRANPCNATALRKASRRLSMLYDEAMAASGLRSTQLAILSELLRAPAPLALGELADMLVMDRSALGHTLRPLERDGLITLELDARDRRRRFVRLTDLGRSRRQEATVGWRRAQERFELVYGAERAAELRGLLDGIASDDRLSRLAD